MTASVLPEQVLLKHLAAWKRENEFQEDKDPGRRGRVAIPASRKTKHRLLVPLRRVLVESLSL